MNADTFTTPRLIFDKSLYQIWPQPDGWGYFFLRYFRSHKLIPCARKYTVFDTPYQTYYTKRTKHNQKRTRAFRWKSVCLFVRLSKNGATYYMSPRLLMKILIQKWIKSLTRKILLIHFWLIFGEQTFYAYPILSQFWITFINCLSNFGSILENKCSSFICFLLKIHYETI